MKKVIVCGILTVVCIIVAVLLRKPMENADLEYTEVEARVISSQSVRQTVRTRYSSSYQTVYKIVVRYKGEDYDLKNAHNTYSYPEGKTVKVYLSGGKMYANTEGVRNGSPYGIAYGAAILGAFGFFLITMVLWSKAGQHG